MMSSMKQIEDPSAVDGPVGSEGGRSPSALSTGQAPTTPTMSAMVPATGTPATAQPKVGPLAPGQRWSVARKREVVLRLLRGESVELLSRELGVPIFKLEQWRQKADAALDGALKGPGHCTGQAEAASTELAAAMQRIGELSMEVELLRAKMDRPGPLARRRSR
jgi:transposase